MFSQKVGAGSAYARLIRNSIYDTVVEVGIAHMRNKIIENVNMNLFYDIDTISVLKRKKERENDNVSIPELTTAVAIVHNNMIGCWEQIRLFPEDYNNRKSTIPDFFTNLLVNDRLLAIEFHSLKKQFKYYKKCLHLLRENMEKRIAVHRKDGPFLIFASDVGAEFLSDFGYNVMDFCSCYINIVNNTAIFNSNNYSLTYGKAADDNIREDFSKKYYRLFVRDLNCLDSMSQYDVALTFFLNEIINKDNILKKLYYSEFIEYLGSYIEKQIKEDIIKVVGANVKK